MLWCQFYSLQYMCVVSVPIIPDWIRGESLALWAAQDAPLAGLLNNTVRQITQDDHEGQSHQTSNGLFYCENIQCRLTRWSGKARNHSRCRYRKTFLGNQLYVKAGFLKHTLRSIPRFWKTTTVHG